MSKMVNDRLDAMDKRIDQLEKKQKKQIDELRVSVLNELNKAK